ncbi:MAG TPA: hypothetical protein VEP69_05955, partial [Thermodesulfovibrionales bacterium]|nr:hypothetical protein [Thermodesulfovibrionales bacterium]
MRERLELKILTLVLVLLIIGVVAAGIMVLTIEKNSLYSITTSSLDSTANIIAMDITRIMLAGKADVARALLAEMKGLKGIEEISIIHYDGHYAFSSDTTTSEADVMKRIADTKAPMQTHDVKKVTFYRPMVNEERCKVCHMNDPAVLGAIKLSISIEKEYKHAVNLIIFVIVCAIAAALCFSAVLWY